MRGFSRHHVVYEKSSYRTPDELAFRRHQGLIVPLHNEFHFELYEGSVHAVVEPPVKPEIHHILGALIMLDTLRERTLRDPLQTIPRLADYMIRHGEPMGENLNRQLSIIREGIVR